MKKRVLVLNCGTLASTDINVALKNNNEFEIWGASTNKNHGVYTYKNYIDDIPNINDKDFIDILNKKIAEYDFKYIIGNHEDMALFLQENKEKIHATIISSDYETALLCRYKSKTYEKLGKYSFVPKTFLKEEVTKFPVFVKKDNDQGGKNAYKVNNKQELDLYAKDGMVICEYLPGEEITVDCFTNMDRELIFCNPRAADRMSIGIDVHARRIPLNDEIKYIATSLNKEIKFRGCWFFQIKKSETGEFKLLEISTRIAGAFSLSRCLDVNLPLMALKDFDGQKVEITYNDYNIEADKQFFGKYSVDIYYNKVYVDFETSFKALEKIDIVLMMFLYQCVNKKIELYLITENEKEAKEFFNNKKINIDLFNSIKEINKEDIERIIDKNSIFISNDDNLKNKLRSRNFCFSNNIIEALLDWRN